MLIDATHPEETRVVVTRGNRVEEFDYESATRKQLRGNIYLAKVARIEPSLQAAFVNYGGNRHGFLAFAEIHPDYYQIPVAVREALMREEAVEREGRHAENGDGPDVSGHEPGSPAAEGQIEAQDAAHAEPADTEPVTREAGDEVSDSAATVNAAAPQDEPSAEEATASKEKSGIAAAEAATAIKAGAAIPLEALVPPTIYEEFSAAIARAEEIRDEIPLHPEDVSSDDFSPNAGDTGSSGLEEHVAEPEAHGNTEGDGPENNGEAEWKGGDAEEGGVVTVPIAPAPAVVETVGSEDALEELPQRFKRRFRHYKIQEVIKRNQIVLVQVVKEERGTKGAALTTYLSLAGRYTVLMPNTASGGGISRKITVPADRKRLKEIAQELEVPEGMGLIIRTAGATRTKAEIKRDFEYLLRLWENVRELTLRSTAPCLVYEEGNLIKRSIRDLYNKDIDEIIVAGEAAHQEAKEFMRMLMPSHAKNVILYKDPEPLFIRYEVERQLNQMFSPVVTLKSGGYIVLNQAEALVAIDVNSGRATREYSIEDTALKTNLEAAEEIARQVRLRDLAGLIVIDFIDMDERRNNRAVERRLKECLRHDRARIQVGHISHFGLLEMSRQRLRQGVVEISTMPCPVCQGVGHVRSTESVALMILRSVEDHLRTQGPANILVNASTDASLYILNYKRSYLRDIESRYGVSIVIQMDEKAHGSHFAIQRSETLSPIATGQKAIQMEPALANGAGEEEEIEEAEDRRPARRKRRRRRGRDEQPAAHALENGSAELEPFSDEHDGSAEEAEKEVAVSLDQAAPQFADQLDHRGLEGEQESQFRRNRRRGRRGGRRHRDDAHYGGEAHQREPAAIPGLGEQPAVDFSHDFPVNVDMASAAQRSAPEAALTDQAEARVPEEIEAETKQAESGIHAAQTAPVEAVEPLPEKGEAAPSIAEPEAHESTEIAVEAPPAPRARPVRAGPPRTGWWQRRAGK